MNYPKRVYAKIDLEAIVENMKKMKANIDEDTGMFGVIKTNAYGHGAVEVGKALEKLDFVKGFCVATIEEAIELRTNSIEKPILILGYTFPEDYDKLVEYDIRPAFFREDNIELLNECGKKHNKKIKVHIKVDTGMSRIGINADQTGLDFIGKVLKEEYLEIEGIFTHFAKADYKDLTAANSQLKIYSDFVDLVEKTYSIRIPIHHCSNSAGILGIREANFDVVRAGITVYGLSPSEEVTASMLDLKPALSLYSHITYIKTLKPGRQISYGGTFEAEHEMRVATVPVGYGDGYPRSLSNKGFVLVRGQKAKILGRVCMDQFMIDVTDIPDASNDDLVTLIGRDGDNEITTDFLGDLSGRFNYELVCDLTRRVPRIYS